MDDAILKYAEKLGIMAIALYLIWSDSRDRAADRAFYKDLFKLIKGDKDEKSD